MTNKTLSYAYSSDVGELKDINQDAGCARQLEDGWIFLAVADGVSMSNKPEVASAIALNTSSSFLAREKITSLNAEQLLIQSIEKAHQAILNIPKKGFVYHLAPPQTTIAACLIKDNEVYTAWVGDSRVYVMQKNQTRLLTEDDSYINWALKVGLENIDPRMAHAITQCLGMQETGLVIHSMQSVIEKEDVVLLCTDGLWNYYENLDNFMELYQQTPCGSALQKTDYLINKANESGGEDNITVAIYLN
jgi:PPM family protein phosphatase